MIYLLRCIECGAEYEDKIIYTCNRCDGLLEVIYDLENIREKYSLQYLKTKNLGVWKYKPILPVSSEPVTMDEGATRLIYCENISKSLKVKLYVKNEGDNPTGSFKDRGMTVGVTKALEFGTKVVACASTGNTSASMSAYASKAGIEAIVLLPAGKIAAGKLSQALVYGAKVIAIGGNFDAAMNLIKKATQMWDIYLLNSLNPYRLEGQKTLGLEVFEQLGFRFPDKFILPIGNAGNISALWKGISEYKELGLSEKTPELYGVQANRASPIADYFQNKRDKIIFVENPETVATAIRIGKPVNYPKAIKAIEESHGYCISVSDQDILNAQRLLARKEGIFVEPASASSIAGVIKLRENGFIDKNEIVVSIATGHGLKDPDIIYKQFKSDIKYIHADIYSLKEVLKIG